MFPWHINITFIIKTPSIIKFIIYKIYYITIYHKLIEAEISNILINSNLSYSIISIY